MKKYTIVSFILLASLFCAPLFAAESSGSSSSGGAASSSGASSTRKITFVDRLFGAVYRVRGFLTSLLTPGDGGRSSLMVERVFDDTEGIREVNMGVTQFFEFLKMKWNTLVKLRKCPCLPGQDPERLASYVDGELHIILPILFALDQRVIDTDHRQLVQNLQIIDNFIQSFITLISRPESGDDEKVLGFIEINDEVNKLLMRDFASVVRGSEAAVRYGEMGMVLPLCFATIGLATKMLRNLTAGSDDVRALEFWNVIMTRASCWPDCAEAAAVLLKKKPTTFLSLSAYEMVSLLENVRKLFSAAVTVIKNDL